MSLSQCQSKVIKISVNDFNQTILAAVYKRHCKFLKDMNRTKEARQQEESFINSYINIFY